MTYDPVVHASGRRRITILRSFAQRLVVTCLLSIDLLDRDTPWYRYLNKRQAENLNHPHLWEGKPRAVSPQKVINLHDFALKLINVLPDSWQRHQLQELLAEIEAALITPRRRDTTGWAILTVARESVQPYIDILQEEHTKILNVPAWGPHVTVVRGEPSQNWGHRAAERISFKVETTPVRRIQRRAKRKAYWWLPVASQELQDLRTYLGLRPRPYPDFHLTLTTGTNQS